MEPAHRTFRTLASGLPRELHLARCGSSPWFSAPDVCVRAGEIPDGWLTRLHWGVDRTAGAGKAPSSEGIERGIGVEDVATTPAGELASRIPAWRGRALASMTPLQAKDLHSPRAPLTDQQRNSPPEPLGRNDTLHLLLETLRGPPEQIQ
jgi:hypothetical protein